MIDDIENKVENLRLQECSLKNRSFWELIISLETNLFVLTVGYVDVKTYIH